MNYHFVLTTMLDGDWGTVHGRLSAAAGATRTEVLRHLLDSKDLPSSIVILFFSLEPDDLGVS